MFNKLKNSFTRKPNKNSKPKFKLAVVVGHNEKSRGAVRVDNKQPEYNYFKTIANYMEKFAKEYDIDVNIFLRNKTTSYVREIKAVYEDVNDWGADASVELHFNASGSPSAKGCEVLTSGSAKSIAYAESVYAEFIRVFNFKERGVKTRNRETRGRGYHSLVLANCPSILTEPFFGSNAEDCKNTATEDDYKALAHCILKGISKEKNNG